MHLPSTRAEAKSLGLDRYMLSRPCVRGHVSERCTATSRCVACNAENWARWHAENKESKREKSRARHVESAGKEAERCREWRARNPDKVASSYKAWASKNSKARREINAKWAERNRAYLAERAIIYRKENPEKLKETSRNTRAKRRGAEGRHTAADLQRIFAGQRGKCAHCRTGIKAGYHVDHIKPLSRGGSNWPRNLQLLCAPCNLRKHAHDPIDFAQRDGRLL